MNQTPFAMKYDPIQRTTPTIPPPISSGKAQRISFLTPEREVYVDAPVKFIARYAEIAGIRRSQAIVSKRPVGMIQSPQRKANRRIAKRIPRLKPFIEKARP